MIKEVIVKSKEEAKVDVSIYSLNILFKYNQLLILKILK